MTSMRFPFNLEGWRSLHKQVILFNWYMKRDIFSSIQKRIYMKIFPYIMNRKNYALTNILAIPVSLLIISAGDSLFGHEKGFTVAIVGGGIFIVTYITSSIERLANIGKSKLWAIGIYVPILNFYVVPMLWSYPPKAKENGLDKKAYVIFIFVFLLVVFLVLVRGIIDASNTRPTL